MTDPLTWVAPCAQCGQYATLDVAMNEAGMVCADCRAKQYGADERHERVRLFTPAPTQIAGQQSLM